MSFADCRLALLYLDRECLETSFVFKKEKTHRGRDTILDEDA